jgi:glucose/arabinose dehydrogenase
MAACWLASLASAAAQSLPPDFAWQPVPSDLLQPVALAFAPDDDLYVATKPGRLLRLPASGEPAQTVLDLSAEVNAQGDRGLLGLALHPGFEPDGGERSWVYLLATLSPLVGSDPPPGFDGLASWSALLRVRLATGAAGVVALPESRQYLLGERRPDGRAPTAIAALQDSHSNGALRFGSDGTLLLAAGDGARYYGVDPGGLDPEGFDDFLHPQTGLRGPLPKPQDTGAFRALSEQSLAGKVLRLDPDTGLGLPSNPWFDGDADSLRSRLWAKGLRNPFRMALDPGRGSLDPAHGLPGLLVVSDVGSALFEELNAFSSGGFDGGWPCREGPWAQPDYQGFALPPGAPAEQFDCSGLPLPSSPPSLAYSRLSPADTFPAGKHLLADGQPGPGLTGGCAMAGAFVDGPAYPAKLQGALLCADFVLGWIRAARFGTNGELLSIQDFGTGWPRLVDMARRPSDGALFALFLGNGFEPASIRRLVHGVNLAPQAALTAAPSSGPLPLSVDFDAGQSLDPDGDPLSYRFEFGDGVVQGPGPASAALHTYGSPGLFLARVWVDDGRGGSASAEVPIAAGLAGAEIAIHQPTQGQLWSGGPLRLEGLASDGAGLPLPIDWRAELWVDGASRGTVFTGQGTELEFVPDLWPAIGEVRWLRVVSAATAADGSSAELERFVLPAAGLARISAAGPIEALGSADGDPELLRDLAPKAQGPAPVVSIAPGQDGLAGVSVARAAPAPSHARYAGLDLVTGPLPAAGLESLAVEVWSSGVWIPVDGLCADPPLAGLGPAGPLSGPEAKAAPFSRHRLRFAPRAGEALRLRGQTEAGVPLALAELEVLGLEPLPPPSVLHSVAGQPIARVLTLSPPGPAGSGNPSLEVARDGTTPPPGSTSLWAQFDSRHPAPPPGPDWFGYRFEAPISVERVRFQSGFHDAQGGFFADLALEAQSHPGGPWVELPVGPPAPAYPADPSNGASYRSYEWAFSPRAVFGLRVAGEPGGALRFASLAELSVHGPACPDCGFESYGSSEASGLSLASACKPAPGLPVALGLSGAGPSAPAFLAISTAPADLALPGGQRLLVDPSAALLVPLALSALGEGAFQFSFAANPAFAGAKLYLQAATLAPSLVGGLGFSNGLELHICP